MLITFDFVFITHVLWVAFGMLQRSLHHRVIHSVYCNRESQCSILVMSVFLLKACGLETIYGTLRKMSFLLKTLGVQPKENLPEMLELQLISATKLKSKQQLWLKISKNFVPVLKLWSILVWVGSFSELC